MEKLKTKVVLILDAFLGESLIDYAYKQHVWILASKTNSQFINMIWNSDKYKSNPYDLTSFDTFDNEKVCEILRRIMDEIDVHYPEWDEIEIIGIDLDDEVKRILYEYDFKNVEKTNRGLFSQK